MDDVAEFCPDDCEHKVLRRDHLVKGGSVMFGRRDAQNPNLYWCKKYSVTLKNKISFSSPGGRVRAIECLRGDIV